MDGTDKREIVSDLSITVYIGVRANIHLGGQTDCPNGFSGGGGVVADIFRDRSSRNFPASILCGVARFFPLTAVTDHVCWGQRGKSQIIVLRGEHIK